jgi:hypothetical protein
MIVGMLTITELIPLDASDDERGRIMWETAELVANLRESGMDPVVGVEATSAGDVVIVRAGREDEPGDVL